MSIGAPIFNPNISMVMRHPIPGIKDVIFNPPATIVLWKDGTKTVVKDQDTDRGGFRDSKHFDKEKGLAMAICKKVLGTNKSKSNYYNEFKKWLED